MAQIRFANAGYAGKRKKTWREIFLDEMELVVPWKALLALLSPHYPVVKRGRRPYPHALIATMVNAQISGAAASAKSVRWYAARMRKDGVQVPPRCKTFLADMDEAQTKEWKAVTVVEAGAACKAQVTSMLCEKARKRRCGPLIRSLILSPLAALAGSLTREGEMSRQIVRVAALAAVAFFASAPTLARTQVEECQAAAESLPGGERARWRVDCLVAFGNERPKQQRYVLSTGIKLDYAGGVGLRAIVNNSDRESAIKYLRMDVTPYNAVGDKVSSTLGAWKTPSFVGPLTYEAGRAGLSGRLATTNRLRA